MGDAIGWLEMLDDLEERLPELKGKYEAPSSVTDAEEFKDALGRLFPLVKAKDCPLEEVLNAYFEVVDTATSQEDAQAVEDIAENDIIPLIEESGVQDARKIMVLVRRGVKHAKTYATALTRERENIAKRLVK